MNLDLGGAELPVPHSTVEVKYEGLSPTESLFQINGAKLGETLQKLGYPKDLAVPIVITNESNGNAWAANDLEKGNVFIYQNEIIESYKGMYKRVLEAMGESTKEEDTPKGLVQRIMDSPIVQTLLPSFLPYLMVGEDMPKIFPGNQSRMRDYIERAKDGTLMPGKPLEEQRERAKKRIAHLIMKGLERVGSWTVGHEYEHGNNLLQKKAVKVGLFLGPMFLAGTLVTAALSYAQAHGIPTEAINSALMTGFGGAGGMAVYGFFKGRAVEEAASYRAGTKHLEDVMECLKVNPEVFQNEVVAKVEVGSDLVPKSGIDFPQV